MKRKADRKLFKLIGNVLFLLFAAAVVYIGYVLAWALMAGPLP